MELTVLGSSSKGNGYILQNDTEALIIECGVSLKEVKRELGFNLRKVVGALVTHEHGDHAGYVKEYLDARINVWMSMGTDKALEGKVKSNYYPMLFTAGYKQQMGGFTVLPFDVKHDCEEPIGFMIQHEELGTLLFATDTYYLPYKFNGLTNIMIECNYRADILDKNIEAGRIPTRLRDRTLESHMSFETCLEALKANDLSKVNNIILLHLSDGNSNAEEFKNDIHRETGKSVYVADRGLKMKIEKTPF